jgi:hypothetical protein
MKTPLNNHEWETLSAYLDGELSSSDSQKFEDRLKNDTRLRSALQELKGVQTILHAIPRKHTRRNFTLKPYMLEKKGVALPRLFPVFSFASALSILLIILSLFFQGLPGASQSAAPAMVAAPQISTNSSSSPAGGNNQSAPIINWGGAPSPINHAQTFAKGLGGGAPNTLQVPAGAAPPSAPAPEQAQPNALVNPNVQAQPTAQAGQDNLQQPGNPVNPTDTPMAAAAPAVPAPKSLPAQGLSPTLEPTSAPAQAPTSVTAQQSQGSGPILGIPPADKRGEIQSGGSLQAEQAAHEPAAQTEPWLIFQIALALIAIICGAVALVLWIKYRRERS